MNSIMFKKLWVFLFIGLIFLNASTNLTYSFEELKLDPQKTIGGIVLLSVLTVLPLLNLTRLIDSPHFENEIYISTAIFSLPAVLGWPLFLRDYFQYKKGKGSFKFELK